MLAYSHIPLNSDSDSGVPTHPSCFATQLTPPTLARRRRATPPRVVPHLTWRCIATLAQAVWRQRQQQRRMQARTATRARVAPAERVSWARRHRAIPPQAAAVTAMEPHLPWPLFRTSRDRRRSSSHTSRSAQAGLCGRAWAWGWLAGSRQAFWVACCSMTSSKSACMHFKGLYFFLEWASIDIMVATHQGVLI